MLQSCTSGSISIGLDPLLSALKVTENNSLRYSYTSKFATGKKLEVQKQEQYRRIAIFIKSGCSFIICLVIVIMTWQNDYKWQSYETCNILLKQHEAYHI